MGANQSNRIYNIPIDEKKFGCSQIMRQPQFLQSLEYKPHPDVENIQDLILHGYNLNKDKEFFGRKNPLTNQFEYLTYDQVMQQARGLGSGIQNLNFLKETNEFRDINLKLIGIYSKNRIEWGIADMANGLYGYTMVPFYDTLGPDSISFVLAHSEISTCYCSAAQAYTLSKTKDLHHLKNIISFDPITAELQLELNNKGVTIHYFQEIVAKGQENILPLPKLTNDTIFTFSYTSGTTGNPKGAMISHKNILASVSNHEKSDAVFFPNDVHLSYLPLPHVYERFVNVSCWFKGTQIAFYSGDIMKLKDDILAAKPTCFSSVPRLLNKFYDSVLAKLNEASGVKKYLIDHALQTKLNNITYNGKNTHLLYDKIVFNKIREAFGGRVRLLICGSAPVSPKIFDFFKAVLSCTVLEGYGQTELSGLETVQVKADPQSGNVGGICASLELKLQDCPEMEYLSSDKDQEGNSMPRGEICVRGHSVFVGYYKDEAKTQESIDEEGWFHSGDIGQIIPNGGLKIIDRKKNIFKLSQAEYVSPEKVENIYVRARGVQEVFIHGESLYNYCIGIIVPNPEQIVKIATELNIQEKDISELCKSQEIINWYLNTIQQLGKKEGLFTFEQAQKIYLEPNSFSSIGCLTSSFKLQRHHAKNHFKNVIQELYKE